MAESLRNFFLIKEKVAYIIRGRPENSVLLFYKYKSGVTSAVASIYEAGDYLVYCRPVGKELHSKLIMCPETAFSMPIVGVEKKLITETRNNSRFIVWNKNYGDIPVSSAVILIRKAADELASILCTVRIDDNGELAFDFINDNKEE